MHQAVHAIAQHAGGPAQPAWAAADQAGQEDLHRRDRTGQSPSKVTDGAVESTWVESL